ncbi:Predicted arabinose efflux permease, MFS family [Micromonospora phaseoli]|uniref:Predicted arabinose efflux permease, MFS family n=1 Tax=Micromonospora phaseoli TaxID=1144548 RepID=A0A1H6YCU4_9ACTN|nr:MFS transporter [Micromonospora phaseoli]PZV99977.1 putative MFS family arabinose efflux permease [Micromonospora phaseoli]GIJ81203.1 MFS transporter [Micromonospora phaseoli]SEJ35012.1 Predicted arabinose efflux permease, MFS family [Micromonospora phaseoli]
MTPTSTRARRLAGTLYAYAFLTDLVLLYPVYALLFADTGLSIAQISSLFVIWSLTGIVLEVPSGAWADATSRRRMLCLAPLCTAAGFALWTLAPSYPAFAVGFVLWGAGGALASGATEALVFDELDRLGAADRYARVIGRARTAGTVGVLGAIVLASPVLGLGGYPAVGAASVIACLLAAGVASRFPEHRRRPAEPDPAPAAARPAAAAAGDTAVAGSASADGPTDRAPDDTEADELGWWQELRAGVAEARRDRAVRAAVLLVAAVTAVWGALDEYTPLLARDTGVALTTVPLLLLIVTVGQIAGGLLAPVGERLRSCGYAVLLACSALALALGALLGKPAGFLLVAVAFCGLQLASVLAEARLQARISGPARATVTSLAGMGTDLTIIAVYVGYGLVATMAGNAVAFAVAAVPYLLVAAVLINSARDRRPPARSRSTGDSRASVPGPARLDAS